MLSCKDITELVSQSMDRRLPLRMRMAIRGHLLMCKLCTRYKEQLLFVRSAMRRLGGSGEAGAPPPASLSPDARERIERTLNEKQN